MDQETKEEFMEKCKAEGKSEEECEQEWLAKQGDQSQCECFECQHVFSTSGSCEEARCPECNATPCKPIEGDAEREEFMSECLKTKTMEECAAEWEAKQAGDCAICDKIRRLGIRRFAGLLTRTFGADVLKMLEQAQTKEEFIVECMQDGGSREECEAKWEEMHGGDIDIFERSEQVLGTYSRLFLK